MGEAKRRGTREARVAEAVERQRIAFERMRASGVERKRDEEDRARSAGVVLVSDPTPMPKAHKMPLAVTMQILTGDHIDMLRRTPKGGQQK